MKETILHVLKDYPIAHDVWCSMVKSGKWDEFFNLDLEHQLEYNLKQAYNNHTTPWNIIYRVTTWQLQSRRNAKVSGEEDKKKQNMKQWIMAFTQEVEQAAHQLLPMHAYTPSGIELLVSWMFPAHNQLKMNTNGSCKFRTNGAATRRVVKDAYGGWFSGFSMNLGHDKQLKLIYQVYVKD